MTNNYVPYADELDWPVGMKSFDATDASIQANPFHHFAWMRENAPVLKVKSATDDLWFVSRYEDVRTVLRSFRQFSSVTADPDFLPFLLLFDPPRHSRVREAAARAFTPKAVAKYQSIIEQYAQHFLDPLLEAGGGEVVRSYGTQVTVATIGAVLGIPVSEVAQLTQWSDDMSNYMGRLARHAPGSTTDEQGFRAFLKFIEALLDQALEDDEESIVSNIARCRKDGTLTADEATHFCAFLFSAGHETTTILIANGCITLAEQPQLINRLYRNPEDIPLFVEELARMRAGPQRLGRVTTEEVELSGTKIPKGAVVRALPGSANRDWRKFPEPDKFDIDRDTSGHLGFGFGIHMCLGAWLARLETQIIFKHIVQRVQQVSINPSVPIQYYAGGTLSITGPSALHVLLRSR
ncbi:MAG: cytochrome P450 [Rhodobiaceae bacterium]|nr:cytochrome P450 [Rhodobiaceae bacterium]